MRMWLTDPSKMCKKHLLGEHVEMHMFLGTLKKKKSIKGYIKNNLLEPLKLKERHDELVIEMKRRGYNHNTPLDYNNDIFNYLGEEKYFKINKEAARNELIRRCTDCKII